MIFKYIFILKGLECLIVHLFVLTRVKVSFTRREQYSLTNSLYTVLCLQKYPPR